jgi:hypothetical protein
MRTNIDGSSMCWRDRATCRVVSRRCPAQRLLFNNPESFCFDAKFSSEMFCFETQA